MSARDVIKCLYVPCFNHKEQHNKANGTGVGASRLLTNQSDDKVDAVSWQHYVGSFQAVNDAMGSPPVAYKRCSSPAFTCNLLKSYSETLPHAGVDQQRGNSRSDHKQSFENLACSNNPSVGRFLWGGGETWRRESWCVLLKIKWSCDIIKGSQNNLRAEAANCHISKRVVMSC